MKRAWHPGMASGIDQLPANVPIPIPATKKLRGPMDLTSTPDTDPPADSNAAQPSTDPAGSRPTMFKCPMCPAIFLSQQGLTQHQVVHRTPRTTATSSDTQTRRGRPPGKDTIQTRLAETVTTEIPIPLSEFTCPLCLEVIGRKGLAQHNASG